MARETYETRVGFFTLGALILTLWGWGWLKSFNILDPPVTFWVRFHDVAGLSNNATVNIQGVRVGTVDQISFVKPEGVTDAPDANEAEARLPKVYTRLKITAHKMTLPKSSEVTIQTLGLVGAKYIEITLPDNSSADTSLIDPQLVVEGKDPVRVEMVINGIAKKLNQAAGAVSSEEAAEAIKHISSAAAKLDKGLDKLPDLTESLKKSSDNVGVTALKFGKAAERTEQAVANASVFFGKGKNSLDSIGSLAEGLKVTNKKVDKILDNPALSKDLKETVELAHKTALSVQAAIAEMHNTVKDKELRQDILSMLGKIQNSSEDIKQSMQVVNKLADDQGLRSDVKGVVRDARDAMSKANTMLSDPAFKTDVSQTMGRVKTAASDVDVAAKQLRQILGKRAPLLQMMFGRPGKLPEREGTTLKDGTSVNAAGGFQ